MEFNRFYAEDLKFEVTLVSGEINDDNLREHILKLNESTGDISDLKELADCRNITSLEKITVAGTVRNADLEATRPESRLALLVSDDVLLYGMARSYQQFSEDRRESCQIFKSLDDALLWLAKEDKEQALSFERFYSSLF